MFYTELTKPILLVNYTVGQSHTCKTRVAVIVGPVEVKTSTLPVADPDIDGLKAVNIDIEQQGVSKSVTETGSTKRQVRPESHDNFTVANLGLEERPSGVPTIASGR